MEMRVTNGRQNMASAPAEIWTGMGRRKKKTIKLTQKTPTYSPLILGFWISGFRAPQQGALNPQPGPPHGLQHSYHADLPLRTSSRDM